MFKNQLISDMDNVFLNTSEFATVIFIDGVETKGFLLEQSGEYEELVNVLTVSESTVVSSVSVIEIGDKTYGVNGNPKRDGFGSVKIILGTML